MNNEKQRGKKSTAPLATHTKKKAMLVALRNSLGVVSIACKTVDIFRSTHYDWLANDPSYREEVEAIGEEAIDFAEHSLLKQVKAENTTATIFYLKTKGRKRGYVEVHTNINREVTDLSKLSDEELDALIKGG